MELLLSIGKEILLVPLWALIQSPFLRFSARLAKTSNVSIKAAFMLGLITIAASFLVSLVFFLLSELIGDRVAEGLSLITAIAATVWLYGYFLRGESGASVGMWRGFIVFALQVLLLLGVLLAVAVFAVLVLNVLR